MASPQLENGYIKIANEIMEAMICRPQLMRGALFPVIAVVWRKTYGWNKKEDAISISQFVEMTGYSKRAIIYALQELEAKNVLFVTRAGGGLHKETNVISFNKNYNEWTEQDSSPQVEKNRVGARLRKQGVVQNSGGSAKLGKKVVQNSVKKVKSFAHTKDINTLQNTLASEDAKNDMAWKKYNENQHSEDLPSIDMDSGEKIEDKSDQESKQVTQLIEWAEMVRGQKFLDRPTQRKFAYQLKAAELSLSEIRQTYMALLNSEYWKEQKRLPDLKTVYSNLKNKKHE